MPRAVVSYTVLVGSPSDVQEERELVSEVVEAWNRSHADAEGVVLRCKRWELDATPELGERPQEIVNRQLVEECDILVAFFWSRAGTPTGVAGSGTEEEINRCLSYGRRILLYFASRPPPADANSEQMSKVQVLRNHFHALGLCGSYDTVEDLRTKLVEHLARAVHDLRSRDAGAYSSSRTDVLASGPGSDLIAIGPDVVAIGELTGGSSSRWSVRLDKFIAGDILKLTRYCEEFSARSYLERFILVESFGEGRTIARPPTWALNGGAYSVSVEVRARAPRKRAQDLGSDMAIGDDGDIFLKNGHMARVAGVDALPQKIRTCLSFQKGEGAIHPDFGSRIAEYFATYKGTPWLDRFLKMDVIRLASIPYRDEFLKTEYTPLQCIERVFSFQLVPGSEATGWGRASVDLEVLGLGRWQSDLKIFIGEYPPAPPPRPPSKDPGALSPFGLSAAPTTDKPSPRRS
jgi:hypothetical protein